MKLNKYRDNFIKELNESQFNIKIKKPVNGLLKISFGCESKNNKNYDTEWIETTLKLNNDCIIINNYMISFDIIKSIELIEPQLFSSGYIELHDYFNNYLQIKTNNSNLKLLFKILNEKIDNKCNIYK